MFRWLVVLLFAVVILSVALTPQCSAQISVYPYVQNFDSVATPALPAGWSSTQNRVAGANDFTTGTTTPRTTPCAVGSTNATITQSLTSPVFDFFGLTPDSIVFYVRRSTTHNARLLVEASVDNGVTFPIRISDSLTNTLPNSYLQVKLYLPSSLSSSHAVKFRWRSVADGSGNTGTLRIDDININAFLPADVALTGVRFQPSLPIERDSVIAFAKIKNVGQLSANNFSVELYVDANNDSIAQPSELRRTIMSTSPLAVNDSVDLSGNFGVFAPASHLVIAKVIYPPDQNPANNQWLVALFVGYRPQSIIVNEIMYVPASPEPEWVELYNTRTDSINLKSWSVSDNIITTKKVITTQNIFIPPSGFILLTKDSVGLLEVHPGIRSKIINVPGFPSLNNTGDAVVVYDNRVAAMDSIAYLPGWGGSAGSSLERIDPLGQSTQQTNWGTSRSVAHSSPGVRNSLSRKDRDLTLDSLRVVPSLPVVGDTIHVFAMIKNPGRESAANFSLQLYNDANADSLPQPNELIATIANQFPLAPLDSVMISFVVENLPAGASSFIARVNFSDDEDSTNNLRVVRVTSGYAPGAVRVNEIMYAPNTGIPEWVEVINTRADTVDIAKWFVGNRSSSRYEIVNSKLLLAPNELLVVIKDTALFRAAYPFLGGRILQVSSLPTFLWNNSGDAVVLMDSRKSVMDSVLYHATWGGSGGKSLERIDPVGEANDSTNWATSTDSIGATPTRSNSQVVLNNDLRLVRVYSVSVAPGEHALVNVVVQNSGKLPAGPFEIVLFADANGDSVGTTNEQVLSQSVNRTLARRESTVVAMNWTQPSSGVHRLIAQLNYSPDERSQNNRAFTSLKVGYPARALVVNEIMFAPLTNNAEYVELYNATQSDIDVAQWKIHDRRMSSEANEYKLSTKSKRIHPGEFFVLASDSSIMRLFPSSFDERIITIVNQSSLSLNNDGDDVVLIDPSGLVIDSVSYAPSWHNSNVTDKTGRSLEKIHPTLDATLARNWTTCAHASGGTPGRENSVFTITLPLQSRLSVFPNPFSPDGDGREDVTIIQYEVPLTVSMVRARIFDAVGRRIRTLANNELSGSHGSIVWDGLDDEKQRARVGIYIVLLEAIDDRGGVIETTKGVVVLAAKL